jgi:hypothetical protein
MDHSFMTTGKAALAFPFLHVDNCWKLISRISSFLPTFAQFV